MKYDEQIMYAASSSASTSAGATSKRWMCNICRKFLSSKRSYDEHMNIHNKSRPFQCEHCSYAAASQMTLRRHKLRNHTPRQDWGYRCAYCKESFMEPASYQQHVGSRHFGRSCTFGCPFEMCMFASKCARHFKEHLEKHITSRMYIDYRMEMSEDNLQRFLIDDEYGCGYGRVPYPMSKKKISEVVTTSQKIDFMKEPLKLPVARPVKPPKTEQLHPTRPLNAERPDILPADSDWIVTEIEVESANNRLPDGQMDIDLD